MAVHDGGGVCCAATPAPTAAATSAVETVRLMIMRGCYHPHVNGRQKGDSPHFPRRKRGLSPFSESLGTNVDGVVACPVISAFHRTVLCSTFSIAAITARRCFTSRATSARSCWLSPRRPAEFQCGFLRTASCGIIFICCYGLTTDAIFLTSCTC